MKARVASLTALAVFTQSVTAFAGMGLGTSYPADIGDSDLTSRMLGKYVRQVCDDGKNAREKRLAPKWFSKLFTIEKEKRSPADPIAIAAEDIAAETHVESLAAELARLDTGRYLGALGYSVLPNYYANPDCREGIAKLIELVEAKIPDSQMLTLEDLLDEQARAKILKWSAWTFSVMTVMQMFARHPESALFTPKSQAIGARNLMLSVTTLPSRIHSFIGSLIRSVAKEAPRTEGPLLAAGKTAKQEAAAAQQLASVADEGRALPSLSELKAWIERTKLDGRVMGEVAKEIPVEVRKWIFGGSFGGRRAYIQFKRDPLQKSLEMTKSGISKIPVKAVQAGEKGVSILTSRKAINYIGNMGISFGLAAGGFATYRVLEFGELEMPKPSAIGILNKAQAMAITDLQKEVLKLQAEISTFNGELTTLADSMRAEELAKQLRQFNLRAQELQLQKEHFMKYAPVFMQNMESSSDEADHVSLNAVHADLSEIEVLSNSLAERIVYFAQNELAKELENAPKKPKRAKKPFTPALPF